MEKLENNKIIPKRDYTGVFIAISAYFIWGVLAIYWKHLETVPAITILCQRIIWSFALMLPLVLIIKSWRRAFFNDVKKVLGDYRTIIALLCSTSLISANWFTYIFAIDNDMIMESSLGYFINPLLNVLLAIVFLKEKMNRAGMTACLLALCGVIVITLEAGVAPWVSLILALTFSLYGLMKKRIQVQSYTSITLETMIASPFALSYLLFFSNSPAFDAGLGLQINILIVLSGAVTAIPLLMFAEATKRISYITIGFTQYVSPTSSFLIAYYMYGEPLPPLKLVGFILIWIGIIIYSADGFLTLRKSVE